MTVERFNQVMSADYGLPPLPKHNSVDRSVTQQIQQSLTDADFITLASLYADDYQLYENATKAI
jgi:hypothetical protein